MDDVSLRSNTDLPEVRLMIDLTELRIPVGQFLSLPYRWSYGEQPCPSQRILRHQSGASVLVTEVDSDETVDGHNLRCLLELALKKQPSAWL